MSETIGDVPEGGPQAPPVTEEQAREYVQRLRSAPVEQLVSELLSGLLNAAQVKLGRKDARLLIDLSGLMLEHARRYLSADLAKQVDQALAQLRIGQVRAESAASGTANAEPNDLTETPTPPGPAGSSPAQPAPAAAPPPSQAGASAASKLWIPGRDF